MNRRGFLSGILAAAVAPAIVRADSLMRIVPRDLLVREVSGASIGRKLREFTVIGDTEFAFSTNELMLLPGDYRDRFIASAGAELARRIDSAIVFPAAHGMRHGDVFTLDGIYEP